MAQATGRDVLSAAFTDKEWNRVPSEIAKKLETYIGEKFDELITAQALLETKSHNAAHTLSEIQGKFEGVTNEHESTKKKLDGANKTVEELEEQLTTSLMDVRKLQTTCNKLESEVAELRTNRNQITDEKDEVHRMLERRNGELERMQADIKALTKQLSDTVAIKCDLQAKMGEVDSIKMSLEYKEKRMEQERTLRNNQVASLTEDLEAKTSQLLNMRRGNTSRCTELEIKLSEKTQELSVANETIKMITESNKALTERLEELIQKMAAEKETYTNTLEAFQQEVEGQKKMTELYKGVSDEKSKYAEELTEAVEELKEKLNLALEKYGDLETKHKEAELSNEEIISKKSECIALLKKELETVNEVLLNTKNDSLNRDDTDTSPNVQSRYLKSGLTLTEVYTQYASVNEQLTLEKAETSRLQSYIQSIVRELEDKGPLIAKQREHYERALETIEELTKQMENISAEIHQVREDNVTLKRAEAASSRENGRLKKESYDLGRQVCYLLREVEHSRAGSSSTSTEHEMSDSTCSADIISKRLVTFSDIPELQATNQKLLAIVRELSSKQEEAEAMDPEMIGRLKTKLETMRSSQEELLQDQEKQNNLVKSLIRQRDTYKTLYDQFLKTGQEEEIEPDGDKSIPTAKPHDESEMQTDNIKQHELELQLARAKKDFELSKEELAVYKKERAANEKIIIEQSDKMRLEIQELMRQNAKLGTKCETTDEMLKVHKSNADILKTQIERLEERNRIYSDSIIKHETAQSYLKDQILDAQTKLSRAEVMLGNTQKENCLLRETEDRLKRDCDSLKREKQSQAVMHTNLELIKATLERNDAESKMRLEENLKEAHRECSAIRRRLQEEQDRFRQLGEHLEKQTATAQARMQEEKDVADKLRKDLLDAREDLTSKSTQLEELSKKLRNSLFGDVETSVEAKRYQELEETLEESRALVDSLQKQLAISKEAVEQHSDVAQAAERQLNDLTNSFRLEKEELLRKVADNESKIERLQEECSELQGELSIQSDGQINISSNLHSKMSKLEIQHKVVSNELAEVKSQLEVAQAEIKRLTECYEAAEKKYSREMAMHSEDLQHLGRAKEELTGIMNEVNSIKNERDCARKALEENQLSWGTQEEHFVKEKQEFEARLKDMDTQNNLLLNQLAEFNTQFSMMQTQMNESNTSLSDSINRSFAEDEVKSSDQLLKIIKFLRSEKDIAMSKCDILEAEHNRMKLQHESLQKQYDEAKGAFDDEKQKAAVSMVTAAKHAEILRKVETLNAITDSNRSLRIERDSLLGEVEDLRKKYSIVVEQLAPLQEKNTELQKKSEGLNVENINLRNETTKWRQRANMLIEKSNRTSPEDWKKLQGERENLVKQVTIERANIAKLTEENKSLTADKNRLEEELAVIRSQHETQKNDLDRMGEELRSLRTQVTALTQDLDQSRSSLIRMTEENRELTETLAGKDVTITDVKNNLVQIRKIAKKYKIQAEEQVKELEVLRQQIQAKENEASAAEEKKEEFIQQGRTQYEERIQQIEQTHTDRVTELNQQVSTTVEENEKNKKEIETLKENLHTSLEKEERYKVLFKNAKERIMHLTEQNNNLKAQVTRDDGAKSAEQAQQSTSSTEIDRLQKEKDDVLAEKQQEKDRFNQEIETLTQRLTQLQRQLGLQQGSKPSTSSEKEKSTTEPPTANIKPMAGHSTNTQTQSVPIQPWRSGGEPPLASIRPMSMQSRTVAVLPTSQSPSTVMVPPQQQVHTTGSSSIEAMSSSPTSSHTDYVPATSSASSAMLGPRQVVVPPTQSNQDTEDEDNNMQVQQAPQQQAVALVLPRVEPPSPAQEQGTSSSSSNTVTTTQAGHKRPREADTESQHEEQGKTQAPKRTRILPGTSSGAEGSVSESGLEVEYQVPTSSQRDHEEDAVIVVESDEEGPDEGDGEDYNMPYEDPDTQDPDQDDEGGNEVEVIEDSSEVPNQSERGAESDVQAEGEEDEDCVGTEEAEEDEAMQPEATSSGTNVSTSVAVTMPSFSRTRPVAPLSRQQQAHLILPHGIEEGGDDGIVPSTPTLFVARRCDGFGEAVSSPHVPISGRFTFTESGAPSAAGSNDVLPEQTLEMSNVDDNSTGRSVPSTPLQTSPHESGPSGEEPPQPGDGDIPTITVSGVEGEADATEGECMGPPSVAGTSTESSMPAEQVEEMQEGDDGVSSEGEKAASTEEGEEEGREAEASPSTNTRSRNVRGGHVSNRRSPRQSHVRGISRAMPTPIVWGEEQNRHQLQRQDMSHRGRGGGTMGGNQPYSPRTARRSRGRNLRSPYGGRF